MCNMTLIQVDIEIYAPLDNVWNIISDLDNEPKFWKGTKMIRNISKTEDIIKREITIAFRDQKCIQEIKVYPMNKIEAKFTEGVLNGKKTITVKTKGDKTILKAEWDIKLGGMMNMFTNLIKNHIKSGTEQALNNIKQEVEGRHTHVN
jgi:carbon monoxide dehydrogenase subunit G